MTPHRLLTATLAGVAAVALAVAVPVVASASSHPAASAATVPTRYLTANGGTVTWTVTVHNAKPEWCTWSSSPKVAGFNTTVKCKAGKITRSARFKSNPLTRPTTYRDQFDRAPLRRGQSIAGRSLRLGRQRPRRPASPLHSLDHALTPPTPTSSAPIRTLTLAKTCGVTQRTTNKPCTPPVLPTGTSPLTPTPTSAGVLTFPNTGFYMTGAIDSFASHTSSWKVTIPTDDTKTAGWAAYDLWFNNWADEVMIQPDLTANSDYDCTGVASSHGRRHAMAHVRFRFRRVWKPGTDDQHLIDRASGNVDIQGLPRLDGTERVPPRGQHMDSRQFWLRDLRHRGHHSNLRCQRFHVGCSNRVMRPCRGVDDPEHRVVADL